MKIIIESNTGNNIYFNTTCSWVDFQNLKLMKQSVVIDTSGWSINLKMRMWGQSFYINK